MKPVTIQPCKKLRGTIGMPGDKSISHRAAICSALASGRTKIRNFLFSDDGLATLNVLKRLGVSVEATQRKGTVVIESQGVFRAPTSAVWMGESGTTARIFMGVFASQPFSVSMDGASSLRKRPMGRVIEPLRLMGAHITARKAEGSDRECLPIDIFPSSLRGITWKQKVASAQVKSAVLFAGLAAHGKTTVIEPAATRDHTERMIKRFGGSLSIRGDRITVAKSRLTSPAADLVIPGDISSAAFFIVAALLAKGSKILIKDVGINPTRMGLVRVLQRMGGHIRVKNIRRNAEPSADLEVVSSRLRATVVKASQIPAMIDELPILMVAASLAEGRTMIEGVGELRVKETDRIRSMAHNLGKLGVPVRVKAKKQNESLDIAGIASFTGNVSLESFSDHRTAMSLVVAGLVSKKAVRIDDVACITKSYPGFLTALDHLIVR